MTLQWTVWARRSRRAEVVVDDRRGVGTTDRQDPRGDYRDPPAY